MDWTNPIGEAVSGGFGVIGSALNYHFQKKLAQQQNEYNMQMWNLQNEYNSPLNQAKRLEEAGLNSALMHGQISTGNASSAPQMVTPDAPKFSEDLRNLAQAFNIEGLRTAIANRKKAQADAKNAEVDAERNEDQQFAEQHFGQKYQFDPVSGMYVPRVQVPGEVIHRSALWMNKILENNFRNNALLIPRQNLIGTQSSLNEMRKRLTAPQIQMRNYEAKYYPVNYWIGNVKSGVQTAGSLVPLLIP